MTDTPSYNYAGACNAGCDKNKEQMLFINASYEK